MGSAASNCEMFPHQPHYCDWLLSCKRIAACLSIVGCLFTVFIIWLFHKYTEFSQRMIIHLSIGTLLQALSYLMVDISTEITPLCIVQGALMQFVAWVILLWILAIIINLLLHVTGTGSRTLERHEYGVSLFCWFVPVLIAALPFLDEAYAPAGTWCWLKNTWGWRFGSWYIWSICSCVFIFVSTVIVAYKLRTMSESVVGTFDSSYERRQKSIKDAVRTLRLYPIAYFLVILFPTINRIQNALHGSQGHDAYVFALVLLHSLTDPLDGAVITLVFVMDKRTRHHLTWKAIRDAWIRKFQTKVEIHEFHLKSRLSRSDFVIAARLSITSIEHTSGETQSEKDQRRKEKGEGGMEAIPEIEKSYKLKIKTQNKRHTSRCDSFKVEVHHGDGNYKKDDTIESKKDDAKTKNDDKSDLVAEQSNHVNDQSDSVAEQSDHVNNAFYLEDP